MLDAQPLKEATLRVRETLALSPGSWDAAHEDELVDLLGVVADLSRAVDALRVGTAGAVSRRSEGFNRAESFAARLGFRGTKQLLMQAFGVQAPTADILLSLAQATAPRSGFSAGELPPFRPALAAALQAGELSADQAAAVHRELPQPGAPEAAPGMIAAAEVSLVAEATGGRVDLSRPPVATTGVRTEEVAPWLAAGRGTADSDHAPSGILDNETAASSASGSAQRDRHGDHSVFGGTVAGPARDQDPWGGRRMEVHLVRTQAKAWANHIDPDGPEPRYEEQQHQRAFRMQAARGGGYRLSGFAPEAEGALLLTVLDSFTAPGTHRGETSSSTTPPHPGAGLRGDASTINTSDAAHEDRTSDQKNFDALHALVEEHVRSGSTAAGTGASSALVISATLSDLERYVAASEAGLIDGQPAFAGLDLATLSSSLEPTSTSSLEDPRRWALDALLSARSARLSRSDEVLPLSALAARLCEDAIGLLVTDDAGSPLAYGRSRRLFSPQQRRVLTVRDGGCRAPACNAPPGWCHAHHVVPWEQGGPSDVGNAVLLCSFHHHEVHRGRLVVLPRKTGHGSPAVVSALTARSMRSSQNVLTHGGLGRSAQGLGSGGRSWSAPLVDRPGDLRAAEVAARPNRTCPPRRTSHGGLPGPAGPSASASVSTSVPMPVGHPVSPRRTVRGSGPPAVRCRRHDHVVLTRQSSGEERPSPPRAGSCPIPHPRT